MRLSVPFEPEALPECWESLRAEKLPIFIYGIGNGAEKLLRAFEERGIAPAGFFASPDFVRNKLFHSFRIHSLAELESEVGDFVIVLAFACGYEPLLSYARELSRRHKLYAPDMPVVDTPEMFDRAYYLAHRDELLAARELLSDDESRSAFDTVIAFKLTGNPQYLEENETDRTSAISLVPIDRHEVFYDVGAYRGDTLEEFLSLCGGEFDSAVCFEPDKSSFRKLTAFCGELPNSQQSRIRLYNSPVWSSSCELPFQQKACRGSSAGSGVLREAVSIDDIAAGERVSFLKIDAEGAEREVLLGASETIQRWKPSLVVSLYHRNEDLFELPMLIKSICSDYRFYLRRQPYIPAWETNLYCVNCN